jgi:HD-like signal output (HDOD) protein
MIYLAIAVGLLVLLVAGLWVSKAMARREVPAPAAPPARQQPATPGPAPSAGLAELPPAAPRRPAARAPARELPEVLKTLRLTQLAELAPSQVEALAVRLQTIPRPPHALDKLVSAQFLASASSSDLNDLMVGEPQIAAKVLASVNSPLYGLQKPLGSIGQAAVYLGMNGVRGICMQYMLDGCFKPTSPEVKACFERVWSASALSSALCFKLAQLLKLPDPGGMVTQIVLSYLGLQASYALLDNDTVLRFSRMDTIERALAEQDALGLCAAEIGTLLLQTWKLPPGLIADVRDIDRVLLQPPGTATDERQARLGLCYLCNRIGAMMVSGALTDLRQFDVNQMQGPELFYLAAYLHHFRLERLPEFLHFPEVLAVVDQMSSASRWSRPAGTS